MSIVKSVTLTPIFTTVRAPDEKPSMVFQPGGPSEETQGYAVLKNRDDNFPVVAMTGAIVEDMLVAAKALAADYKVPLHRPEWLKKALPEVISIQVMPYRADRDATSLSDDITIQIDGPDDSTDGWAVYLRRATGEAMWVADVGTQEDAEFFGQKYAEHHGVEIEPYPWLKA
jgi:hypothetical protein